MSATDILRWLYQHLDYPLALLAIPVLLLLLFLVLRKKFIEVKDDPEVKLQKKRVRRLLRITRPILIILVAIALASPYLQQEKIIEGDPFIELLVDNSTSMALFQDISAQLAERLEKRTNVEVKIVGSDTT